MKFNIHCSKHPTYKAVREPKSICGPCWFLHHLKSSGTYVTRLTERGDEYKGRLVVSKK